MVKKTLLIFSFLLYALVLTLVLLIVRFPKQTFISHAAGLVEEAFPGTQCSIAEASYRYPASLGFSGIVISSPADALLTIDSLLITPSRENPLVGFSMDLKLYNGTIESAVIIDRKSDLIEFPAIVAADIDLELLEPLQRSLRREGTLRGVLGFSGSASWRRHGQGSGSLSGSVLVRDFRLPLKQPILQSSELEFTEIRATAEVQEETVLVTEGQGAGDQYDAAFSGRIEIQWPWPFSDIMLSGQIMPRQHYLEQNQQVARVASLLFKKYQSTSIPFVVSGSFQEPTFSFGEFR